MEKPAIEVTTRRFFPTDELIAAARRWSAALRLKGEDAVHVVIESGEDAYSARLSLRGEAVESNAGDPQVAVQRAFTALAERLGVAGMLPA